MRTKLAMKTSDKDFVGRSNVINKKPGKIWLIFIKWINWITN